MMLALAALMTAAAPGCVFAPAGGRGGRLSPALYPRERDVPMPEVMRFVPQASEDYRDGRRRVYVRHRYIGDAHKDSVRAFFRRHMPLTRWALVSDANHQGYYILRFEKESESCEITIKDAPRDGSGNTLVDVRITPLERRTAPVAPK